MITTDNLTVILGMGITGLSVARFLSKANHSFVIMDSRHEPPNLAIFQREFPSVLIITGGFDETWILKATEIVVSPGLSLSLPELKAAKKTNISIITDIDIFKRFARAPVIAITGSNGKSTVTTLVAEMAKTNAIEVAVGGNLGTPALDLLEKNPDCYVLELSSFQLEGVNNLGATVATVLNVSEDHMDRYPDFLTYALAKQRIYQGAKNIIINRDDALTQPMMGVDAVAENFGINEPLWHQWGLRKLEDLYWLCYGQEQLISQDNLLLKGRHNLINVLASLAIARVMDWNLELCINVAKTFKGLDHRCQWIKTINNVEYINDSKATNVGATIAAIKGLAENKNIILIAGGEGKGGNFEKLEVPLRQFVKQLILIGTDGGKIAEYWTENTKAIFVNSMVEAVNQAYTLAVSGDIVLLSPACASFDMFANFEDRGEQFNGAVEALTHG